MKSVINSIAALLTLPFRLKRTGSGTNDHNLINKNQATVDEPVSFGPKTLSEAVNTVDEMAGNTGMSYQVIEVEPDHFVVMSEYYFISNIHKVLYSTPLRKINLSS